MLIYICFQNNGALQLEQNASPSLSILTADDGLSLIHIFERTIEEYDLEAWNSFKTGDKEQEYSFRSILNGLCSEKLIPSGKYVITPN